MRQIRMNVFETNSSSTHSICISKQNRDIPEELPKLLIFRHAEFGWDHMTYHDTQNKANYLYQAIYDLYRYNIFTREEYNKILTKIADILIKYDVMTEFDPVQKDAYGIEYGYIDHAEELGDFIRWICRGEKKLLRYLFSGKSFIVTGNDNEGHDVKIHVDYKCDKFYKGN